ncbi:MAG: hypothetical protein NTW87_09330 [Planctomycetota bacterium]|nr:hypothetical protein [Planctomycetota bacterium]
MKLPFEASWAEIQASPDLFVSSVFSCLESEFLVLPKGHGFVEYPVFEKGYEALKQATAGFSRVDVNTVLRVVQETPIAVVVLRAMLGLSPPEWAYLAAQRSGTDVPQGFARTLDRGIRKAPLVPLKARMGKATTARLSAMVKAACELLAHGAPNINPDSIHRLDKADTSSGLKGVQSLAAIGVPYAMLLYERFLGRPFAGHRDSVSELIGDNLESAIEDVLAKAGISYRKTKHAERLPGFDQTPDFIVPSEFNPQVIIEAKIAEDDGTARDKATRIQHLGELSARGQPPGGLRFEVIACIGGRGFGVRREDMNEILLATRGKVFTVKTLNRLVECTRLREFSSAR